MLLFCPGCGNGLIVEEGQRCHRFACNTCPYVHNITRKVGPRGASRFSATSPEPALLRPSSPSHFLSVADPVFSTSIWPFVPPQCRHLGPRPVVSRRCCPNLALGLPAPARSLPVFSAAARVIASASKSDQGRPVLRDS